MEMLKKFYRELIILVLLVVVALAVSTCNHNQRNARVAYNSIDSAFNYAKRVELKNGELIHRVNTLEIEKGDLNKTVGLLGFDKQHLESKVGKLNRIVAHWEGRLTVPIDRSIPVLIVPKDPENPISGNDLANGDASFDLDRSDLPLNPIDSVRTIDFSLTAYYGKRPSLFKSRPLVADIYFDDPTFVVNEFKGFVVQQKRPPFFQRPIVKITLFTIGGFVIGRSTR